jgi:hypothetical protein
VERDEKNKGTLKGQGLVVHPPLPKKRLFPSGKYLEALDGRSPLWAKTVASLLILVAADLRAITDPAEHLRVNLSPNDWFHCRFHAGSSRNHAAARRGFSRISVKLTLML